ncbi:Bph1 protein [Candida orthopsilosis Co 90-125]|uniref:Bph1 protein n=1 Tax=Candida orthopsilosis (strain 90-125) TaxID=1136231 RepID=H8WWA1_CANO9|nr:Bph1 protein [Candida orthopsilosis Co 90-125]CCG20725.1 Bph1 protein [Candida orthopsilosis Co 90-125]
MRLSNDDESQDSSEQQIIKKLTELFPQLELEEESLLNWEVELAESIDTYGIEEAIAGIAHFEPDIEPTIHDRNVSTVLDLIKGHIQEGNEFGSLIIEILCSTLSQSQQLRIKNHGNLPILINLYMSLLKGYTNHETFTTLNALKKLILILMDLGCDIDTFRKIVSPLYTGSNELMCQELMELLNQILEKYPTHYPFILTNQQINFPISDSINKSFSIYGWIKLSNPNIESNNFCIVTLLSSDSSTCTIFTLRIVNGNQIMVELKNPVNKSRSQFAFNHIINEAVDEPFQIALTYDERTNLNLYINGELHESIPCAGLHKDSTSWNKISIGETDCGLVVRNISLTNVSLPHELIEYLFCLGVGTNASLRNLNDSMLSNLRTQLSYNTLFTFARRQIVKKKAEGIPINQKTRSLGAKSGKYEKEEFGDVRLNLVNKLSVGIRHCRINEKNVLFDSNDVFNDLNQRVSTQSGVGVNVVFCNPVSLYQQFHVFGTLPWLLKIMEDACKLRDETLRDTLFLRTLSLLFKLLTNDWRLSKEFEGFSGYNLLGLILLQYKATNPNLTFHTEAVSTESAEIESLSSLLNILLSYCGFDFANSAKSVIINFECYRVLVLNFDLFYPSDSFEFLLSHVYTLLVTSDYKQHNLLYIKKASLLKRLLHFLKSPKVKDGQLSPNFEHTLSRMILALLAEDATTESILAVSSYIIFALYSPESSKICANAALIALTDFICDPKTPIKALKKFSRSITIHWITLLFKSEIESAVRCGVRLLTRLLNILGKHIVSRFFEQNHGLDMLSSSLESWWSSGNVLRLIFCASFGVSGSHGVAEPLAPIESADIQVPEFLLLLNELELNAMYTLSTNFGMTMGSNPSTPVKTRVQEDISLSFDVLHSLNMCCDWLEKFNVLSKMENSPQYMNGLVYLLGYLKLSLTWFSDEATQTGFSRLYKRLLDLLTQNYVSSLRYGKFHATFNELSDFSKLLLLNYVFPKIFEHVRDFITLSNFIHDEAQFSRNLAILLSTFHHEFAGKNYFVATEDLQNYLTCQVILLEKNQTKEVKKLEPILVETVTLQLVQISCDIDYAFHSNAKQLTILLKELLYRQMTIFDKDVLKPDSLVPIIKLVLGMVLTNGPEDEQISTEITFSFLRTAYLQWMNDFPMVIQKLNFDTSLMNEFFTNLMTRDDNESLSKLRKYPPVVKSILKDFQALKQEYLKSERLRVSSIAKASLHSGAKIAQTNSIYVKSFENDCQLLKRQTMRAERAKYNRTVQDRNDNMTQYNQAYHTLKSETIRIFGLHEPESCTLDYIENDDRMRRRFVIEDLLPESEKLSYEVQVPLLQSEVEAALPNESIYTVVPNTVDTMSFSNELLESIVDNSKPRESHNETTVDENEEDFDDKNRRVSRSLYVGDQIVSIWNVCQINGLVPVESLLILGSSYLYLIENYFHGQDGNIVDVHDAPQELRDPITQLVNLQSSSLDLSSHSHRTKSWGLDKLSCISRRQFLLRDNALEMFFSDGSNILITCLTSKESSVVYNKLSRYATGKDIDPDLTQALASNSNVSHNNSISSKLVSALSNSSLNSYLHLSATKRWKMGEISNFYYLMIINTLAGRTFNDLTQYPVFPWVIADYMSESLDLSNPKAFRDLSKPMGAQTSGRANQFKERYEALASLDDRDAPPFHYGTHYSSAMIVTSYLIRLKPHVQSYLLLQGGKFDHADRLFNSIEKAWYSASRDNTTDVRELIPEFYYLPEFLVNSNNFDFGKLQNGEKCDDVKLPPWAKGDPKLFIAKNREALESPYVSANLHLWIDLVFGLKQSGPYAIDSLNVFHHYSYNGAIDLDNIEDDVQKRAVIGMINNFGQTPAKVFSKPHVMKEVLNLPSYYLTLLSFEREPALVFESKIREPIAKLEISSRNPRRWVGRHKCVSCEDELLIRKPKYPNFLNGSLIINDTTFTNIHSCDITSILQIGFKIFLTGAQNGLISVWKYQVKPQISLEHITTLRGHFCSITNMAYSRSFKIGVSVDEDGVVILWDLIRFNFIKKFSPDDEGRSRCLASISNDSGNIAIMRGNGKQGILKLYNVNGGYILSKTIEKFDNVSAVTFGTTNIPGLSGSRSGALQNHVYWSNELLVVARNESVEIWELTHDSQAGWELSLLQEISVHISGKITTICLLKCSEVDNEDRLIRGVLKLIFGDSTGKVYVV